MRYLLILLLIVFTSCQKDGLPGYGYNVGVKATIYITNSDDYNKSVTISYENGDRVYNVDTTLSFKQDGWASHGYKFLRPLTKTESYILLYGASYIAEVNMNNGKGTPKNNIYDYNIDDCVITSGYYKERKANYKSVRECETFKIGLEKLKGLVNIDSLIYNANKEVDRKDWL